VIRVVGKVENIKNRTEEQFENGRGRKLTQ
jgi:hypothetical protein